MCATLYVYDLFSFVFVRDEKRLKGQKGQKYFGNEMAESCQLEAAIRQQFLL